VKFILWKIRRQQWGRIDSAFCWKTYEEESTTFSALVLLLERVEAENAVTVLTEEKHISRFALLLIY
jgi:hypothetical protein